MSPRLSFRLAAAAFAVLAILMAALQTSRPPVTATPAAPPKDRVMTPNAARLAYCQSLGAAGAQDPDCLKAWNDARARFLGAKKEER
jgi:conjugative transfer region protein TrbK